MQELSELTESELWIEYELVKGLEKAHVLDHLYLNSMRDGNFQQALTIAEQSSSIYSVLGTERESFYCKFGMAKALHSMHNFEEAIDLFVECEVWASLFGEDDEQATIWEHLGDCFVAIGNPDEGVLYFEKAEGFLVEFDDRVEASNCAKKLGDLYSHQGDYDKSLTAYLRAVGHLVGQNETLMIGGLNDRISDVYLELGNPDEAIEFAKRALHISLTCSCKQCQPQAHFRLGQALLRASRSDEARSELSIAEDQFHESESAGGQAKVWLALAELELGDNPGNATEYAERALTVFESLDWQWHVCETQLVRARIESQSGDLEAAKRLCLQVQHECDKAGVKALAIKASNQLSLLI